MKSALAILLTAILPCFPHHASAGFGDKDLVFSEAEVQAAIDKNGSLERRVGSVLRIILREPPRVRLGIPEGRAGITGRMDIALLGNPPIPVQVKGHAGIRYDDQAKAFFLENPIAESVESVALPREFEPQVRRAVSQLIATYFRDRPAYMLRENGSTQESTARWLLRSVRIETGRVVATLSPF